MENRKGVRENEESMMHIIFGYISGVGNKKLIMIDVAFALCGIGSAYAPGSTVV